MRGEETQLAGVFRGAEAAGLACLPGTHSKWAEIASGTVRRFATAMTGDLYAAVRGHTILALADPARDRHDEAVFRAAVAEALAAPATLPAALFAIRARALLSGTAPEVTGSALSGFLIGAEIAWARGLGFAQGPVRLVAAGVLAERYLAALAVAEIAAVPVDSAAATVAGLHAAARALFGPDGGVPA
jgi:2-dehydro-3-deoxygalactonokinase